MGSVSSSPTPTARSFRTARAGYAFTTRSSAAPLTPSMRCACAGSAGRTSRSSGRSDPGTTLATCATRSHTARLMGSSGSGDTAAARSVRRTRPRRIVSAPPRSTTCARRSARKPGEQGRAWTRADATTSGLVRETRFRRRSWQTCGSGCARCPVARPWRPFSRAPPTVRPAPETTGHHAVSLQH